MITADECSGCHSDELNTSKQLNMHIDSYECMHIRLQMFHSLFKVMVVSST